MSTSTRKSTRSKSTRSRAFVPTTALAKSVSFDSRSMHVTFTDGRVLSVPLEWFPILREATPKQRLRFEIGGGGIGIHWPDLDEDLSVSGLMAGVDRQAG
jgi:hypothetical protein